MSTPGDYDRPERRTAANVCENHSPPRTAARTPGSTCRTRFLEIGDLTLYATVVQRLPSGRRESDSAAPWNSAALLARTARLSFGPDAAWNYELGEKAKFFDNWLTVNSDDATTSKWTGIQQVAHAAVRLSVLR